MPHAASAALTCGEVKVSSSQARGDESSSLPVSSAPRTPFLRQRFQPVPASARPLIGDPSRRKRCSASPMKPPTRRRHVSASSAEKAHQPRDGLFEVVADAEPASVGEDAGEAVGHRSELQPCRFQFICIFPVKGGAGEEAEIHRAEIVPEAGQRHFARLHRATAAGFRSKTRFSNPSAPNAPRRPDCCGRHRRRWHRIRSRPQSHSFRLKDNCRCICFRLVAY